MRLNGLIVAGAILGILRGGFGVFTGIAGLSTVWEIDKIVPGFVAIFGFEVLVSFMLLMVGLFALLKGHDPEQAGDLRGWGIVILVAGAVDAVWSIALVEGAGNAAAAAFGSWAALSLIGVLIVAGAIHLGKSEQTTEI